MESFEDSKENNFEKEKLSVKTEMGMMIEFLSDEAAKMESRVKEWRERLKEEESSLEEGTLPENHPAEIKYKVALENFRERVKETQKALGNLKEEIEELKKDYKLIDEIDSEMNEGPQ